MAFIRNEAGRAGRHILMCFALVLILGAFAPPVSNNAVALGSGKDGPTLYSFLGLEAGKTHDDVSRMAVACALSSRKCRQLADVPVKAGRLAAIAVHLRGKILLFGGYTVAKDGREVSTPDVLVFDPKEESYLPRAPMPTPVDDSVAVAYQDRYVYLVSGWHDHGNVSLTQVYDAQEDKWFNATPYPGTPVFGHAGGNVGNTLVVVDGVAVTGRDAITGRRQFGLVNEAWHGTIDENDPAHITWRRLSNHPGAAAYRMAAVGNERDKAIIFTGGSHNPYNFNGVGYNGKPSQPLTQVFGFDIAKDRWVTFEDKAIATMDHRGMVFWRDKYWIYGGMAKDQKVINRLQSFQTIPLGADAVLE